MKKIKNLLVIAALAVAAHVSSQPIALPASVDVSAIGAASYSIPIEVVPGTNGLQPNLAIVYNSLSGLGTFGQKWSLQGISAITRVPQNKYYDKNVSPVKFDTTDRFALDGSRMLLTSGSSYHATNAEYCFETENFSRIKKIGTSSGFYFQHQLADGTIIEYGGSEGSRLKVANGKYLSWMISKVTDVNGNYMTYTYGQANGEIWIDHIDYTYLVDGTSAFAQVAFGYESVSNPNDGFVSNYRTRRSKLMTNIVVRYGGSPVRNYAFFYDTQMPEERLTTIKLFDTKKYTFLASTSINWTPSSSNLTTDESLPIIPSGFITVAGKFDNDRVYDIFAINPKTMQARL